MTTTAPTARTTTGNATTRTAAGTSTATRTASSQPSTRRHRRGVNVALWALQYALAALYVFAAIPKLTSNPQAVAGFDAIGWGDWFRYLIGSLEIAGAVALLLPFLCGVAAVAFVGLMIGATITEIVIDNPAMAAFPALVGVLVAVVAWTRRDRTARLVRTLRTATRR